MSLFIYGVLQPSISLVPIQLIILNIFAEFNRTHSRLGVVSGGERTHHGDIMPTVRSTLSSLPATVAIVSTGLVVLVIAIVCFARGRLHRRRLSPPRQKLMSADKPRPRRHLVNAGGDCVGTGGGGIAVDAKSALPFIVSGSTTVTAPPTPAPSLLLQQLSPDVFVRPPQWAFRPPRGSRWTMSVVEAAAAAGGFRPPVGSRRIEPVATPLLLSCYSHDDDCSGVSGGGRRHCDLSPLPMPQSTHYSARCISLKSSDC